MQEDQIENKTDELEKTTSEAQNKETIKIPQLTEAKVNLLFNQLQGLIFKVDDAFFKVNFINKGQRRFSADLVNDIKSE